MNQISEDGWSLGPVRAPKNTLHSKQGSIHVDEVAETLGFKGGTVSGRMHLDPFVPMILDAYGAAWFREGGLSLYFTQATVDGEEVRARFKAGPDRALLEMHSLAGDLICKGTAAPRGRDDGSELEGRMRAQAVSGELRILAGFAAGDEGDDMPLSICLDELTAELGNIAEVVPAYAADRILPPSEVARMAHLVEEILVSRASPAVGLFGGIEVQHMAGPLRAGLPYLGRARIEKLGDSPKTETAWCRVAIRDAETRREVALVNFMCRFMKASSPLWS